jgi:alpha-L-fucosidase
LKSAHHRQLVGDPKVAGYKDLIPCFTGDRFDPEAWAALLFKARAQFGGLVAAGRDNFALWDSEITRWNSRKMGPRRDIVREFSAALRQRGLKFAALMNHGSAWQTYETAYAYDAADVRLSDLYGEAPVRSNTENTAGIG